MPDTPGDPSLRGAAMQDPTLLFWARTMDVSLVYTTITDLAGKWVEWMGRDFVIIDIDGTPAEQRCTGMHELAHKKLGHPIPETEREYQELELAADRWVAEQLIPDGLLADALRTGRDMREVEEILQVDHNTLAARLGTVRSQWNSGLTLIPRAL